MHICFGPSVDIQTLSLSGIPLQAARMMDDVSRLEDRKQLDLQFRVLFCMKEIIGPYSLSVSLCPSATMTVTNLQCIRLVDFSGLSSS